MNLSQLSNNYQFLYSPKSWLHVSNKNYKIVYVFLQLIIVPYINLKYIVIIFITTLIFYKLINLPTKIQMDICIPVLFFLLVLVNSTYYTTKYNYINRDILKIKPFNLVGELTYIKNNAFETLVKYELCLPSYISRLVMISLTYLFTIKIFLLTTNYEEVIVSLVGRNNTTTIIQSSEISFIVVLSSQFLKIIFTHINKLQIAYLIRGIKITEDKFFKKAILLYFLLLNGFLITFYSNIEFIVKTLHSRDLLNRNLYLINIYNAEK